MRTPFRMTNFGVSSEPPPFFYNPLRAFLLVATSIFLLGYEDGLIETATKFASYEDFQPGPDGGIDLVWARIGLRDAQ